MLVQITKKGPFNSQKINLMYLKARKTMLVQWEHPGNETLSETQKLDGNSIPYAPRNPLRNTVFIKYAHPDISYTD